MAVCSCVVGLGLRRRNVFQAHVSVTPRCDFQFFVVLHYSGGWFVDPQRHFSNFSAMGTFYSSNEAYNSMRLSRRKTKKRENNIFATRYALMSMNFDVILGLPYVENKCEDLLTTRQRNSAEQRKRINFLGKKRSVLRLPLWNPVWSMWVDAS